MALTVDHTRCSHGVDTPCKEGFDEMCASLQSHSGFGGLPRPVLQDRLNSSLTSSVYLGPTFTLLPFPSSELFCSHTPLLLRPPSSANKYASLLKEYQTASTHKCAILDTNKISYHIDVRCRNQATWYYQHPSRLERSAGSTIPNLQTHLETLPP